MDDATYRKAVIDALNKLGDSPPTNTENLILDERIKGIEKITRAARTRWFWFFGILGFVALTVFGLEDAALFSHDATATLPILNFEVNLRAFLVFAPGLIVVVFMYLHGQIEMLWNDLSALPDQIKGPGSDEKTYPVITELPVWLVIEFALLIRDMRRGTTGGDGAVQPSDIGRISAFVMGGLVWLAAPAILIWLWWQTLVLHSIWLSGWQVVCVLICLATVHMSWKQMYGEMGERDAD